MASSKQPPLKPCPFCGGAAGRAEALPSIVWSRGRATTYWVECTKCFARPEKMKTRRGADNRWNKREGGDASV